MYLLILFRNFLDIQKILFFIFYWFLLDYKDGIILSILFNYGKGSKYVGFYSLRLMGFNLMNEYNFK